MRHLSRFRALALVTAQLALMVTLLAACGGGTTSPASSCPASGTANSGAFDLTVSNILVTQAIQTISPLNSVPLVADRSTAVRVMVGNSGNGYVAGVTGTLSVFVNGTALSLSTHATPVNGSIPAPVSPQWANECNTLNFEIPAPTNIPASSNVRFHVDITPVSGETNTANNSGDVTLSFAARTTPLLYFTRINFANLGLPDMSFVQPGTGDAFVRGIYPVNDSDPTLYRQGLFPTLPWPDPDGNNTLEGTEEDNLLAFLGQCRQLIVNSGVGPDDRVFLYGWLKGNPVSGNGYSSIGGRVAFGNTDPIRGQRTYAHELGHNFGFFHNGDTIGNVGWDVGGRLANNPASNNVAADGRIKPTTFFDIMNPGHLTNEAWIEPARYMDLYNNSTLATSPDARVKLQANRVVVIQGIFDPTGTGLLRPNQTLPNLAIFRYPWPTVPVPQPSPPQCPACNGRYLALLTSTTGDKASVPFDALVDTPEGGLAHGFFEVQAKLSGDIASLQIVDTQTGKIITERTPASGYKAPTITLTAPAAGGQLGETTTISWDAQYSVGNDQVQYQIAYSPDNGKTFVPLAVGVPGTTRRLTVNSVEIPKSSGQGIIRVFLSDGLNTTYADATGLTPTAAKY